MDNTMMQAILWIAAGGLLGLFLLRRRKRNLMSK
jgi:LPXTG-motif cell wall-anchored protein